MGDTWWWNLTEGRAVPGDERPHADEVLGPYPTREAAEAWRSTHKSREDSWAQEDDRWEGDGPKPTDDT